MAHSWVNSNRNVTIWAAFPIWPIQVAHQSHNWNLIGCQIADKNTPIGGTKPISYAQKPSTPLYPALLSGLALVKVFTHCCQSVPHSLVMYHVLPWPLTSGTAIFGCRLPGVSREDGWLPRRTLNYPQNLSQKVTRHQLRVKHPTFSTKRLQWVINRRPGLQSHIINANHYIIHNFPTVELYQGYMIGLGILASSADIHDVLIHRPWNGQKQPVNRVALALEWTSTRKTEATPVYIW